MSDPLDQLPPMVAEAIRVGLAFAASGGSPLTTIANEIAQAVIDSRAPQERVEMRPAYNWTCPECGRDNFQRSILAEASDEDLHEHGIEPGDPEIGAWQTYPRRVTCEHCEREFEAMGFGQDNEEDEPC